MIDRARTDRKTKWRKTKNNKNIFILIINIINAKQNRELKQRHVRTAIPASIPFNSDVVLMTFDWFFSCVTLGGLVNDFPSTTSNQTCLGKYYSPKPSIIYVHVWCGDAEEMFYIVTNRSMLLLLFFFCSQRYGRCARRGSVRRVIRIFGLSVVVLRSSHSANAYSRQITMICAYQISNFQKIP